MSYDLWSGMCTRLLVGVWRPRLLARTWARLSPMCCSTHLSRHRTESVLGNLGHNMIICVECE